MTNRIRKFRLNKYIIIAGFILIFLLILSALAFSTAEIFSTSATFSNRWASDDGAIHETRGVYWYIPQSDGQLTVIEASCDRSRRYPGGNPEDFVTDRCQILFGR